MDQTRSGIFETNSSSVHSFTVSLTAGPDDLTTKEEAIADALRYNGLTEKKGIVYDRQNGILDFNQLPYGAMSFGREYSKIDGFFGKAMYALAAYSSENDSAGVDSILAFVKDELDVKTIKVSKETGFFDENRTEYNFGDIDHQSVGYLQDFIEDKHITIRDFILRKRYSVTTDGD